MNRARYLAAVALLGAASAILTVLLLERWEARE